MARCRRYEMVEAVRHLGLDDVPVAWLGLADSAVSADELSEALGPIMAGADMCLAPWPEDPHPDHQAAGTAARRAAGPETQVWGYPVWTWPWKDPQDAPIPWKLAARHQLGADDRQRKLAAIAAFGSQLGPGPLGEAPIICRGGLCPFPDRGGGALPGAAQGKYAANALCRSLRGGGRPLAHGHPRVREA